MNNSVFTVFNSKRRFTPIYEEQPGQIADYLQEESQELKQFIRRL
jgi:hypothetical protein